MSKRQGGLIRTKEGIITKYGAVRAVEHLTSALSEVHILENALNQFRLSPLAAQDSKTTERLRTSLANQIGIISTQTNRLNEYFHLTAITKLPTAVYVVETSEPITERFSDGVQAGIGEVYFNREDAEAAAAGYNDAFPDYAIPAFVVGVQAR